MGLKGPNDAVEGCSPPQEIKKAARRTAIFLVNTKSVYKVEHFYSNLNKDLVIGQFPIPPQKQKTTLLQFLNFGALL